MKPLPIAHGYPTTETFEKAAAGLLRLGGCVIGPESRAQRLPEVRRAVEYVDEKRARAWAAAAARDFGR